MFATIPVLPPAAKRPCDHGNMAGRGAVTTSVSPSRGQCQGTTANHTGLQGKNFRLKDV